MREKNIIRLRPHHLREIKYAVATIFNDMEVRFEDKSFAEEYGREFAKNYNRIFGKECRKKTTQILIVKGCDDMCSKCNFKSDDGQCLRDGEGGDEEASEKYKVKTGELYSIKEILRKIDECEFSDLSARIPSDGRTIKEFLEEVYEKYLIDDRGQ